MLSACSVVTHAVVPLFLSASLISQTPDLPHPGSESMAAARNTHSILKLPDQQLRRLNGTYTRQYYEDRELVTEVVYVQQLDNDVNRIRKGTRQSRKVPTSCKTDYPGDVMWFKHGWCYERVFLSEVQANPGKRVFAHVGVIDDNGRHTKTDGGWSAKGGQISRSLPKPKTCKNKCTVLITYRTK